MADVSGWLPLVLAVAAGLVGWGVLRTKTSSNSNNIKALWERKAEGESLEKIEKKVGEIDEYSRRHDRESANYRLEQSERFAKVEKSVEISLTNHNELVRNIMKLETTVDKLDKGFEDRMRALEIAINRRNDR